MNKERLQALKDQAWATCKVPEDYVDKFAELIVRNCGYHADVFSALGCPVDMDPTETKPSDYIKREMGITE